MLYALEKLARFTGESVTRKEHNKKRSRRIHAKRKCGTRKEGYVEVMAKWHPNANKTGYVMEHRIVIEKALSRYVQRGEVIHHINRKRDDNRLENLALLGSNSDHSLVHDWLEKIGVYVGGFGGDEPQPLVLKKPAYWAGAWINQLELPEHLKIKDQAATA